MTKPVHNNTPPTWFERHGDTFSKAGVIIGLALFFIGMGAMSAAAATPSTSNFFYSYDTPLGHAQDLPTVTAIITGEGFGGIGISLIVASALTLYRLSTKEKNKTVEKTTHEEA